MIKVSSWVKALTLYARDLNVIGLTTYELSCLIYVSRIIWAISSEWHPQRRCHQYYVTYTHCSDYKLLIKVNSHDVQKETKISNLSGEPSQVFHWSKLFPAIMISKIASIKVHYPIIIIMTLEIRISMGTLFGIILWVFSLA